MSAKRYREIEVAGSPRAMGEQIGEAARDEIQGFCAIALERVRKTTPVSHEHAFHVARSSGEHARAYSPDVMAEVEGMAAAAAVTVDEIMLLQVRNQFQVEREAGCTALSVPAAANRGPIVAQNWDNDPALDPFTVVLTRRPHAAPALMTCTQAGLVSYLGFNDAGIGACVNTLPAPSRETGVPHYFSLRGIYQARSLEGAIRAVETAYRAIPANIMLATPEGPADLEVTIDGVRTLRPSSDSDCLTHTNHALHPDLIAFNQQYPELIQSGPRKQCIDTLLRQATQPIGVADVQKMLANHEHYPRSICRHVNEDPQHGFWQTVFSIIIEPQDRRMHVSRGNALQSALRDIPASRLTAFRASSSG